MRDDWTRWQGHVINGVFPLGRYIGCSDHSGVFLTRSASGSPSDIAIKLVPADRAVAESLLPRWKRARGLTHPNLLRLYEWGGCQLEGLPYLYVVMEYADQTLAQLLQSRALTDLEAREMLAPVLNALAFLHGRSLVQGQLKPANLLVVGDQLKLASDTIRRIGEAGPNAHPRTPYDPPESLQGAGSPAGDVWALGITLCEALARRQPSINGEHGDTVALPADFPHMFRDVVARCLSRRPEDRPGLPGLTAWAGGQSESAAPAKSVQPPVVERAEPKANEPKAPEATTAGPNPVAPAPAESIVIEPITGERQPASITPAKVSVDAVHPARPDVRPEATRVPAAMIVGAVLTVALVWAAWHLLEKRAPAAPPPVTVASSAALASATGQIARPTTTALEPSVALSPAKPRQGIPPPVPHALHEVIPNVPLGARRTIHGHIKVWVRVIVDQDGSVFATLVDRAGPSKYFQRLAQQAARQWTFPPDGASSRRLMQIRFEFSRDGTQARAVPLH